MHGYGADIIFTPTVYYGKKFWLISVVEFVQMQRTYVPLGDIQLQHNHIHYSYEIGDA